MNTSIKVWGVGLLVGALSIPVVALAAEVRGGEQASVSGSEVVKNDLYIGGGNVSSSGTIQGDLAIGGGTLIVGGPVSQDILAAGGNITLLGTVGDDVRAAGGNIIINGKVTKDVVVLGGQTQISGGGVGGDVLWAGGTLHIDAPVGGAMQLSGGEVFINTTVAGNVTFKGSKLTLGPKAVIGGNLDYSAQSEATMETGAVVKGKTTYEPQKSAPSAPQISAGAIAAIVSGLVLWKFLATLVLALVLGLFFRRFSLTLVGSALEQPLLETGRGLIVFIVLPVASVMLLISLLGIPLGILGLISFVALMIVAGAFAAVIMGSLVHKWIFKPAEYRVAWQTILLGVVVSTLVGLIPVLGGIVKFLFILLALGAMVKIKWDTLKEWR